MLKRLKSVSMLLFLLSFSTHYHNHWRCWHLRPSLLSCYQIHRYSRITPSTIDRLVVGTKVEAHESVSWYHQTNHHLILRFQHWLLYLAMRLPEKWYWRL